MSPLQLAVCTAPFQLSLKQAIDAAARIGVQGVQLDTRTEAKPDELSDSARRQVLHYLDERGLTLGSLSCSLRQPLYERERLDHRIERVRGAMVFASQLKVRTLTLRPGRIPLESETADRQRLIEILRDLAMFGNHLGVVPTLTPSDDSAGSLLTLINEITEGPLAIDFDPAAFVLNRRPPIDALRELHAVVGHVQVRDGRRDEDGIGVETIVGQGEVRWIELIATTAEMHYRGWLTLRRTTGEDKIGDCTRAAKFLRGLAMM
jgi:sugar phosphate isomerase/epimerase